MKVRTVLVLGAALLLAACSTSGRDAAPEPGPASEDARIDAALTRAREAARALGADLMQRLLAEMEQGGPAQAVRICAEVAPSIAAEHSSEGLVVRRVSLRVRNPADVPDDLERKALEELALLRDEGRMPAEWIKTEDGPHGRRLRYLKPIMILPTCLVCHGEPGSMDSDVRRMIAERYPADQATGYAEGDLRGAVSVTVALD